MSTNDANVIRNLTNCNTIRAFLAHLRSNSEGKTQRRIFTLKDCAKMEAKGVREPTYKNFQRSIIFLAVQSEFFPPQVFSYIDSNYSIKKMDLTQVPGLGSNGLGACLSCIVRHKHPVKRLNLSDLRLNKEAAEIISIFIGNLDINLEELNLKGNFFTPAGVEKLYSNLKTNPNIKAINFVDNNLTNESVMKISTLLKSVSHIKISPQVLNLSYNS